MVKEKVLITRPVGVPVPLPPSMPALATLTTLPAASSSTDAAAASCYGQTHNPHNSTHYPGYVLVSSDTICPGYGVTVTVDLYRTVFGSSYFLDRGGPGGGTGKVTRNAKWKCPRGSKFLFTGYGYHAATGHTIAATSNSATITCA